MSADQYRAIAECLSAKPKLAKRACYFEAMAESAALHDGPSSATAPYLVLTSGRTGGARGCAVLESATGVCAVFDCDGASCAEAACERNGGPRAQVLLRG
jgi:hypothetical protein